MKKLFIFHLLIIGFCLTNEVCAMNDSCLITLGDNTLGYYNPDDIKIDTCVNSPTYGRWYARKTFIFHTDVYIFQERQMTTTQTYSISIHTRTEPKTGKNYSCK